MFSLKTKISMAKAVITKNSPFYVQFYISNRCHLQCKMCNIVEANADLAPFPHNKIEKIADNLVSIGSGVVLLTGGEPFLRDDIDDIVRIFLSRNLNVRLQTAGLLTMKDTIKRCAEIGARDINVSLDSLDEGLSDYINGVKNSWQKALETIAFISNVFPNNDSICALGCVLSHYNINEIEPMLEFATRIGWWLSLVPVHITDITEPMNFRGYDEFFKFKAEDHQKIAMLIEKLKKMKRDGYLLFDSDDYLDSIYHFVSTGRPDWRANGICDSPNLYFVILPDGRFAPCCDYRMEDALFVYDDNFPGIYNSKEFRKKVKLITSKCPGCNFGSFPEMTLSTRNYRTIFERIHLQIKAKKTGIRRLEIDEIYSIIEDIKKKFSIYYARPNLVFRQKKYKPDISNISKRNRNS